VIGLYLSLEQWVLLSPLTVTRSRLTASRAVVVPPAPSTITTIPVAPVVSTAAVTVIAALAVVSVIAAVVTAVATAVVAVAIVAPVIPAALVPVVAVVSATPVVVAVATALAVTVDTAVEELDVVRWLAVSRRRSRGSTARRRLLRKTEPALVGERDL